ncbi:MAG: hypothetical protein ABIJ61_09640 [bacterium]
MSHSVLVTGAGGGGGENLINSLRASGLDLNIYGSNMDEHLLAKSSADFTLWLPSARLPRYTQDLAEAVEAHAIELVIPNNDTEVGRISRDREMLPCRIFLPPDEEVSVCQDKLQLYRRLAERNIPQAHCRELASLDDIDDFVSSAGFEKYWLRPRKGSGSMGATWVRTAEQARNWVKLWVELRGFRINDFTISEFLPGRDYAFQSVWKNGELQVAKMVERLSYVMGRNRLSNMSSTPAVARTIEDKAALETIIAAIHTVSDRPQGNYNLDLKGNCEGVMCVTEFNIGRFCMITPIFDLTGRYNTAEVHVACALDLPLEIEEPIDIEPDIYLIRELDTRPQIISGRELETCVKHAKVLAKAPAGRPAAHRPVAP